MCFLGLHCPWYECETPQSDAIESSATAPRDHIPRRGWMTLGIEEGWNSRSTRRHRLRMPG